MSRKININRAPLSSAEVEKFKDFADILNKYQASNSVDGSNAVANKGFNIGKSLLWTGIGLASITAAFFVYSLYVENNKVETADLTNTNEVKEQSLIIEEWSSVSNLNLNGDINWSGSNDIQMLNVTDENWEYLKKTYDLKVGNKATALLRSEEEFSLKFSDELNVTTTLGEKVNPVQKEDIGPAFEVLDEKRPFITIDFDPALIPNLKEYSEIFWHAINDKDLSDEFFSVEWEKADVIKEEGRYLLKFTKGSIQKSFYARPALSQKDYQKAFNEYTVKAEKEKSPKEYQFDGGIYLLYN